MKPKKTTSKKTRKSGDVSGSKKIKTGKAPSTSKSSVKLRVAVAQINTIVGDFKYNADKIISSLKTAIQNQADIVLFPELTVSGYPPEDLLLKKGFIQKNVETLKRLVPHSKGITAVIGYVETGKKGIYNSAALVSNGKLIGSYQKMLLPNYGVFDEKRYFLEGTAPTRFTLDGLTVGLTICEDIWSVDGPGKNLYEAGGVGVLLNISSSPYYKGRGTEREELIKNRAQLYNTHIVYANLVGGQDELIFDGQSLIVSPAGSLAARGNSFAEEMIFADLVIDIKSAKKKSKKGSASAITTWVLPPGTLSAKPKRPLPERKVRNRTEAEEIYEGLVMGTRDYMRKNGFKKAVIGLSGGIDSALTAAIARDALGSENVVGILMPSPFSSSGSIDDALDLAENLEIEKRTLPIEEAMKAYEKILPDVFREPEPGVAKENLQARIRGNLLMGLSNKLGWLVLTTGNKSELSVGYCTLYGDMAGGFSVIKDVPKTWVYELARWFNEREGGNVIPENILVKEPSAELRPDQKDTDSLPPYPELDRVLNGYIEEDLGLEDLEGLGLPTEEIERVIHMVDANEYKRRQGPPGIKITPKAFGKDRRLPITSHYKS